MSEVRLVIVYGDRGEGRQTYRRSDTLEEVSCVDCSLFTDQGTCAMGYCHPWPLGRKVCSQWQLRTEPHAMKKCAGKHCYHEIPQYRTNRHWCSEVCEFVHKQMEKPEASA